MKRDGIFFQFVLLLCSTIIYSQARTEESLKANFPKIISLCLDANVKAALPLLEIDSTKKLSERTAKFKTDFENRFKYKEDNSTYLAEKKSPIDALLQLYNSYWRKSVLNPEQNFDSIIGKQVTAFLEKEYEPAKISKDSISFYSTKYIESKGMHTAGFGKTGKLYDLLVWKTQKDTVYTFTIHKETISTKVFMMEDFVTLGWEEYATLNYISPSGWATPDALYCVRKAYDLTSESFLISYLAHEGRHFSDYKLFPKLTSADLEYRGKLTELSIASDTLYQLIGFFITNANYDSENGHSVANFCVIRDLSTSLFGVAFEKDINKWKSIEKKKINTTAYSILKANTKALQRKGVAVERFIKL